MNRCVMCEDDLKGRQRQFCGNACKQAAKYATSKGELCATCKQPMKPRPILGGFHKHCTRKACVKSRS